MGVLGILLVMSIGTWYFFFTKFFEQGRIMNHARIVERRFWTSGSINEGVDKLPKNSMFRAIARSRRESGRGRHDPHQSERLDRHVAVASTRGRRRTAPGRRHHLPGFGWFGGPVRRSVRNGVGHPASPVAIGVAGQASIDKVAGPVGEALIMTALGLFAAVPAVLLYNFLVRRNKVITEKLRGFAGDLQTYLISKGK